MRIFVSTVHSARVILAIVAWVMIIILNSSEALAKINPICSVSGRVRLSIPGGKDTWPMNNVEMTIEGAVTLRAKTDINGVYKFANLPRGSYSVTASKGGYIFSPSVLSVKAESTSIKNIDFTASYDFHAESELQPQLHSPWAGKGKIAQGNCSGITHDVCGERSVDPKACNWENTYAIDIQKVDNGQLIRFDVLAPMKGEIVGYLDQFSFPNKATGPGKLLFLKIVGPSGREYILVFAHLMEIYKKEGVVELGEIIGKAGVKCDETPEVCGFSRTYHLHFQISDDSIITRRNTDGSIQSGPQLHTIPFSKLWMKEAGKDSDFRNYESKGDGDDNILHGSLNEESLGATRFFWSSIGSDSLSVSLNPAVTSGNAPLGINLAADVSGSAGGTINYTVWWDCAYEGTSVESAMSACGNIAASCVADIIGIKCDGINDDPFLVNHIYTNPGSYTAKVIVERGNALPAESRAIITVTAISDFDGDGIPDDQDICPHDPNNDIDSDTVCGDIDNCPTVYNPPQSDLDGDAVGDTCDPDYHSTFNLPDTGQTTCYDVMGNLLECPQPGQPLAQDGSFSMNPLAYVDNGDGTVTDRNTGLMWQQTDDGNTYNWHWAAGSFDSVYNASSENVCANLRLGDHEDWRLPSKKELVTISNYGLSYLSPLFSTEYFRDVKSYYWSSTEVADNPFGAMSVSFAGSSGGFFKDSLKYVRCVRGTSGTAELHDNSDGTVTDLHTGLMWQQGEPGDMSWGSALTYCNGLALNGYIDWRLPNIKEIESLIHDSLSIDTEFFPNAFTLINGTSVFYWSSTTDIVYSDAAWVAHFYGGVIVPSYYKDARVYSGYVRCVRGGNFAPPGASSIQLPQTGQKRCYDSAGMEINCVETGQDGEIRAGVVWTDPRFTLTYCDATGPCEEQSSDCDGNASTDTVKDNLTGLIWTRDGNLTDAPRTWQGALDYANGLTVCGYSDWHLPNINELESLINANEMDVAVWLNKAGFTDIKSDYYWSSTHHLTGNTAWIANMQNGYVGALGDNSYSRYILPVRIQETSRGAYIATIWQTGQKMTYATGDDGDVRAGIAWPTPRFSDNGNGTVTDNLTQLMWSQEAYAPGPSQCLPVSNKTWQEALDYIKCLNDNNYLQHNDWRLPNRKELQSLIDFSRESPSLPLGHPFLNVQSYYYWSSTTASYFSPGAWFAGSGIISADNKSQNNWYSAWPVRGGVRNSSNESAVLVKQSYNNVSQTVINESCDNFSLGQTLGDQISGMVNFITLRLKLTNESYGQNSDHRIYVNFYRTDTQENVASFSYLMSAEDVNVEKDITFESSSECLFEVGIPYVFVGSFRSVTYYGSSNRLDYSDGYAFHVGNYCQGPTQNWPPTSENPEIIKDLYFVLGYMSML